MSDWHPVAEAGAEVQIMNDIRALATSLGMEGWTGKSQVATVVQVSKGHI